MKTSAIMARLQAKYPGESEYLQAVQEVLESVEEVYMHFINSTVKSELIQPCYVT